MVIYPNNEKIFILIDFVTFLIVLILIFREKMSFW